MTTRSCTRRRPALLMLLAAAALGLVVSACGGDDLSSTTQPPANGTDRAFAVAMIAHHQAAVDMARIAETKGDHAATQKLAASIVSTQNAEIRRMRLAVDRFKATGVQEESLGLQDHAIGMGDDASKLKTARPFDREFIDLMIPHHQGAIRMAHIELDKGTDLEMRRLAKAVVRAQTREIDAMNLWRVGWYGGISPAGGVPAENADMHHDG
jgi:uncharacterized protein (DUF305 family)